MKIAIIGGGSCGLYLAWKLAAKGNDVTVFESNKIIENKTCSGLFSERILEFVPESKNLIERQINSVFINFPRKKVELSFSKKFLIIDHSKLNVLLSDLAHKAGASIVLERKINALPIGFDKIIGCDGSDSFVRKHLKLRGPSLRLGIQGFANSTLQQDFVEAWACDGGFIWKIPRTNHTEYGIMSSTNDAYRIFSAFTTKNKLVLNNIKAKLIPQGLIIPKDEVLTLCGDAAGLTKPWSGGGVIWGFKAAQLLIDSFPDFTKYRSKTKSFFGPKIILSKLLIKAVYFFGYNIPWLLPKRNKVESDFLF